MLVGLDDEEVGTRGLRCGGGGGGREGEGEKEGKGEGAKEAEHGRCVE
jgi:hypothetical protein